MKYIERGMNSGIFVGSDSAGAGKASTNLLDSVTGQLSNSLKGLQSSNNSPNSYTSQNNQNEKKEFINSFRDTSIDYSLSNRGSYLDEEGKYLVIAGSVIPMVMVTGVDSDLPGMLSARVTEDVYDSLYATHILIPKGSMVIGSYDSSVSWGQRRVLIVWTRLSRPDGFVLDLQGMQGVDKEGKSGVQGKVKTYIGASVATALLTSVFSLGINYTTYSARKADETGSLENAVNSAGTGVGNTLKSVADKLLNRQPTIKIKPGTRSNIFVNRDIRIPVFYR